MAGEIFVDTSGLYALLVRKDDRHARAAAILADARTHGRRFVTTDYILDETVTLLCARGLGHLVAPLLDVTLRSAVCAVEWCTPERFASTADFLVKHLDQRWSFTDCLSFQTMKARRLRDALTKDEHFEHAGFVALLRAGR